MVPGIMSVSCWQVEVMRPNLIRHKKREWGWGGKRIRTLEAREGKRRKEVPISDEKRF